MSKRSNRAKRRRHRRRRPRFYVVWNPASNPATTEPSIVQGEFCLHFYRRRMVHAYAHFDDKGASGAVVLPKNWIAV